MAMVIAMVGNCGIRNVMSRRIGAVKVFIILVFLSYEVKVLKVIGQHF